MHTNKAPYGSDQRKLIINPFNDCTPCHAAATAHRLQAILC